MTHPDRVAARPPRWWRFLKGVVKSRVMCARETSAQNSQYIIPTRSLCQNLNHAETTSPTRERRWCMSSSPWTTVSPQLLSRSLVNKYVTPLHVSHVSRTLPAMWGEWYMHSQCLCASDTYRRMKGRDTRKYKSDKIQGKYENIKFED